VYNKLRIINFLKYSDTFIQRVHIKRQILIMFFLLQEKYENDWQKFHRRHLNVRLSLFSFFSFRHYSLRRTCMYIKFVCFYSSKAFYHTRIAACIPCAFYKLKKYISSYSIYFEKDVNLLKYIFICIYTEIYMCERCVHS